MIKNFIIIFCIVCILVLSILLYKKQDEIIICKQEQVNIVKETYSNFYKENLKQISQIHTEIKTIKTNEKYDDDLKKKLIKWWVANSE